MAFGHEVGFSDPSVPQKGENRKYAKNQSKWRWLSGPESRHMANDPENREPDSEMGKMAYDHEM